MDKSEDYPFLESYYDKVILPLYEDAAIVAATWKDHGRVGPDNWAHYFEDEDGAEYVLLNEDYPDGSYLNDGLSHEMIAAPKTESGSLQVIIASKWIPNISGYFTLFKEHQR